MTAQARGYAYAALGILGLLLATLVANIASRGIFVVEYIDDLYFVFDAAWRVRSGQVPHSDFISPIGQAFYWPFAIILQLVPYTAKILLWANLLVAAVVAFIAWVVLHRRLPPLLLFLAVASIILAILTPRDSNSLKGTILSYLAPYNRWSWAGLGLVAYIALIAPRRDGQSRNTADGLMLGIVLVFLAYLKITYFAGAVFLVGVGFLAGSLKLRMALVAATLFVTAALLIEILNHNTLSYLNDILHAVNVSGDQTSSWRIEKFWGTLRMAAAYFAFIVILSGLMRPIWPPAPWVRFWARPLLISALAILMGAAVAYQNHSTRETNMYVVGLVIFAELARRAIEAKPDDAIPSSRAVQVSSRLAVAGVVGGAALFSVIDASSIIRETIATRDGSACFIPVLKGTRLAGFMQSPRALEGTLRKFNTEAPMEGPEPSCATAEIPRAASDTASPYQFHLEPALLSDLTPALRKSLVKSDRVLLMDFANPYAAIFGLEPSEGGIAWWDGSRTVSGTHFPAPDRLFKSTTVIVERKNSPSPLLWNLYGKAMSARYRVVAETSWWRIWRRAD